MSTISFYEYHNIYGFWGKKKFSRNVFFPQCNKDIYIKHNSFGIRDDEFNLKKQKHRIICLGGSHTWGAAVDIENRYSNILNQNNSNKEILNFGHCSFGLDQIYFFLRNEIETLNPDQIILEQYPWALLRTINNYVNGYIRPHFLLDKKGDVVEKKLPYISKIELLRKFYGGYMRFKKEFNEFQNNIISKNFDDKAYIDPVFKLWNQIFYKDMYFLSEYIFKKIKEICDEKNIKLLVVVNMSKEEYFNNENNTELIDYKIPRLKTLEILKKLKINYIDLEFQFRKSIKSPFFDDGHINKNGNNIIANNIQNEIC